MGLGSATEVDVSARLTKREDKGCWCREPATDVGEDSGGRESVDDVGICGETGTGMWNKEEDTAS